MEDRARGGLIAAAVGVAVGVTTLAILYAPFGRPPAAPSEPAPASSSSAPKTPPPETGPPGTPPLEPQPRQAPIPFATPAAPSAFAGDASGACPNGMTLVEGEFCPLLSYTCLRKDGIRCAEYARGARCLAPPDPRRYCIDVHEWPNRPGENPTVYVDWYEAKALCASVGKRLCRRSEWMLACEGPKRLPYPWGYVRQPSPCNIDRAAIPFDALAMVDASTRELELSRLWQADRIGTHPDCVSAYGAFDMSGNVDEWTDNLADNPDTKYPSTLNGGYWGPVRDTCRLTTRKHGPKFRFYQVGFRCCADPIDGRVPKPPAPFVEGEDEPDEGEPYGDSP